MSSTFGYEDKQVLVVTVNAPRTGDPIHCIAKDGERVRDGEVYVRHVGQSAPARSADLRMLSTRLLAQLGPGLEVEVFADADARLPLFDYPADWVDRWIDAERDRLMAPLRERDELTSFLGLARLRLCYGRSGGVVGEAFRGAAAASE